MIVDETEMGFRNTEREKELFCRQGAPGTVLSEEAEYLILKRSFEETAYHGKLTCQAFPI